jgi:hypothetical protein
MAYDIVGDIHGQADKLEALLTHLGYRIRDGAYRHPERAAIFVGDFIDRGPRQLDSVMTVRRMVEAGSAQAIMGNHEFNAIAWQMPDPDAPGEFLRRRSGNVGNKNRHQHAAFLAEVESDARLHREVVDWFLTLPLWLDLPGLRVVHACWHEAHMHTLEPVLTARRQLTLESVVAASRRGSAEFLAVETLTKGIEVPLPDGHFFHDKDGHPRNEVRIRWWDRQATTYRQLALMPDDARERLPDLHLPPDVRPTTGNPLPVFFGHYWMQGRPVLQSPTAACVDYSADAGGDLVAYRWDGEPLNAQNFAWVA